MYLVYTYTYTCIAHECLLATCTYPQQILVMERYKPPQTKSHLNARHVSYIYRYICICTYIHMYIYIYIYIYQTNHI